MRIHILPRLLLRYSRIVTLLLSFPFLTTAISIACEWDYRIWQVHSKSADPLYRFVQNGKAGYIDGTGKVVIKPQFSAYGNSGDEFHDGLLEIGVSGGQYVDVTGKLVIDKGHGWNFSEGLAAALDRDHRKWGYIDRSGEFAISPRFLTYPKGYVSSFSDGLAMIEVGKKYGYIDRTGEFVIQPRFLHATDFHDGMARVVVAGPCAYHGEGPCPDFRLLGENAQGRATACKFAFIDKSGSIVTSQQYDYAKEFSEGLAPVLIGKKWGYIDKKGRTVIPPGFAEAEPFSDGLARVKLGEQYGYIDHSGILVIPAIYKYAEDFSDGLAVVCNNWSKKSFRYEEFYYINRRGEQAISEQFALASPFFKGLAHVKVRSNKTTDDDEETKGTFAYIDTSGRKVFTYAGEK
ncbi:MAG TPA: WG repeat-containing protein [Blastocatellia bacterium]|nr:WG repeat-containing protein [Blastocatellia bacterium]